MNTNSSYTKPSWRYLGIEVNKKYMYASFTSTFFYDGNRWNVLDLLTGELYTPEDLKKLHAPTS